MEAVEHQRIIIVDPDQSYAAQLTEKLRSAGFLVEINTEQDAALSRIEQRAPDIVVSEVELGHGSGFNLLQQLRSADRYASLPFVFLTKNYSPAQKMRSLELQADDFLDKSRPIEEIVKTVKESLVQKRQHQLRNKLREASDAVSGSLKTNSVNDLLVAISATQKTGVLTLSNKHDRGVIYFRDGSLIDAGIATLNREKAIYRMMLMQEGSYLVQFREVQRPDEIAITTHGLVKEGQRRAIEWNSFAERLPSFQSILKLNVTKIADRLGELPDEVNAVLRLFDGKRSILRVIDDCAGDDLTALGMIARLFEEQFFEILTEPETESLAVFDEMTPCLDSWPRNEQTRPRREHRKHDSGSSL
ncbi:MAG: response regulator [Myxococcales bacterium]|nr:MAG: response regulator [Myxococcales bacterium]